MKTEDDLAMLKNPGLWPVWPYLPVKRRNTANPARYWEIGFLYSTLREPDPSGKVTIYLLNMFDDFTEERLRESPKVEYDSPETCLADRWIVD